MSIYIPRTRAPEGGFAKKNKNPGTVFIVLAIVIMAILLYKSLSFG